MGMNAAVSPPIAPDLSLALAEHLRATHSRLTHSDVFNEALRAWLEADQARHPQHDCPSRGYQWKTVFLPDGTELRMTCAGANYHARVVGDLILFEGRSVSPRGMTLAIAGKGRNAWRDLWLRFVGERNWKSAMRCRRELERAAVKPVPTAVETMAAAAAAMSEALKTALALVEHSRPKREPQIERRGRLQRRENDLLADTCAFD